MATRAKMAGFYPEFTAWYQEQLADRCIKLRLRNKMLGDYEDACFVFGRLSDHEFNVTRDNIGVTCNDIDALDA